jgi:hypothetical protein
MGTWYTTREDVMSAQDIKATAYSGRDIDRAIEAGARDVEAVLHRKLYPWTGTRSFDYPQAPGVPSWRIWFGEFDLTTLTSITNGDATTVTSGDVFLQPQDGPPYDHIDLDRGSTAVYAAGDTNQRAVAIAGLWAYSNDEETAGTTAEALDLTETLIDGSALPTVGVGSVIRVDSERMTVTDKGWLTTAQTGSLTAANNAQTLAVADGTAFAVGETLLLDAERVKVVDIAGNNLIVRRAVDGTTLAAHTTATIYALRLLTVTRGALGTTAATHLTSATVYRWLPPGPAAELNLAYAVDHLLQRQSGYARTVGSGDNQAEAGGRGIREIEKRARMALGRQARTGAI